MSWVVIWLVVVFDGLVTRWNWGPAERERWPITAVRPAIVDSSSDFHVWDWLAFLIRFTSQPNVPRVCDTRFHSCKISSYRVDFLLTFNRTYSHIFQNVDESLRSSEATGVWGFWWYEPPLLSGANVCLTAVLAPTGGYTVNCPPSLSSVVCFLFYMCLVSATTILVFLDSWLLMKVASLLALPNILVN